MENWIQQMCTALEYVENNLSQPLAYDQIARHACMSSYHFQRVFGLLFGYTLGEYIRNRRLYLAGVALQSTQQRVLDIALDYGYDSAESFCRAFRRFHGFSPSEARKPEAQLKPFSRLSIDITKKGGTIMNYRIEQTGARKLLGYRAHFDGVPADRNAQEESFFVHSRLQQYVLSGMTKELDTFYTLISKIGDDGYDFYIAQEFDREGDWLTEERYTHIVQNNPEIGRLFETILLPPTTYAVFETPRCRYPVTYQAALRQEALLNWLPQSSYELVPGAELTVAHFFQKEKREKRFVELWIPVQKK